MTLSKQEWRARIRAQRRARSAEERRAVAEALAGQEVPSATTVAGYVALPGEPDPSLLLARLARDGSRVLLPRVEDGGRLTFAETGPLELGRATGSGLRIPEPTGPSLPLPDDALLLIPALAVDESGTRLGQGGGYYDRLLAARRAGRRFGPVLAVVHPDEVFPAGTLPRESHDATVDGYLTT